MENVNILFLVLFLIIGACIFIFKIEERKKQNDADLFIKKISKDKKNYFGPSQITFIDETPDDLDITVKRIMYRGKFINLSKSMNVSYIISAVDFTNGLGHEKPVLSFVDLAQEPDTNCFQLSGNIGFIKESTSITEWIQIGVIIPQLIQPPHSGIRDINIVIRMFDTSNPPTIYGGFSTGTGKIILEQVVSFVYNFTDKGYEEESLHREESQSISLKIGVVVAMSDGSLDDAEGQVLKNWIIKEISPFSDDQQQRLKKMFNQSLKDGYSGTRDGSLSLSELVARLAVIGEKKTKYDAVELCLDVMAADGIADPKEMLVIRNVAKKLDLDMDEIDKMREKITLNLSATFTSEDNLETLVGLVPNWSNEKKLKHLRSEFQKWSNRLNSLTEGEERKNAQNILDNIAILRKKYG